jgi:hypothetical protein
MPNCLGGNLPVNRIGVEFVECCTYSAHRVAAQIEGDSLFCERPERSDDLGFNECAFERSIGIVHGLPLAIFLTLQVGEYGNGKFPQRVVDLFEQLVILLAEAMQ